MYETLDKGIHDMNTIKIDKKNSKMVAHAALAGLEMENTIAGYLAAGNRTYWGIETDVRVTKDKQIIAIHNHTLKKVSGVDMVVAESTLEELQKVPLYNKKEGTFRSDLRVPTLAEYISICKQYEKVAVLELKGPMGSDDIANIIGQFKEQDYLDQVIIISFEWDNLVEVRKIEPELPVQFLTGEDEKFSDELVNKVAENRFDMDINIWSISKEVVDKLHAKGIKINCWTVDGKADAEKMAEWGVDYITTNILE